MGPFAKFGGADGSGARWETTKSRTFARGFVHLRLEPVSGAAKCRMNGMSWWKVDGQLPEAGLAQLPTATLLDGYRFVKTR